jgi:hypothetical protein
VSRYYRLHYMQWLTAICLMIFTHCSSQQWEEITGSRGNVPSNVHRGSQISEVAGSRLGRPGKNYLFIQRVESGYALRHKYCVK